MRALIFIVLLIPSLAIAKGEKTGKFDYYVMALSWSPNWCERIGDDRNAPQCAENTGYGWILHGLWPQYETGWPANCPTPYEPPAQSTIAQMLDIMPDQGLIAHQWRKHGSCSGLAANDYFALSRKAFSYITYPKELRMHKGNITRAASEVEAAFLEENPNLAKDQTTITCRDGRIHETRICFDKGLNPRICGVDVIKDCTLTDAAMAPVR